MSSGTRRAFSAAVVAALACAVPAGRLGASHFSWLGHESCPGPLAFCETLAPAGFAALGEFEHHTYRIADETAPEWRAQEATEALVASDGTLIARVSPGFRRLLDAEGAARLRDGRIVNAERRVGGAWRYLVVRNAPFGVGAPGYKLVPYRTLSVNPKRIPLGAVLYLPSLAGTRLPSGEVHDGFCFVHDTHGGAANTIDIFIGFDRDTGGALQALTRRRALPVYRVDPETAGVLNRRFKSQFDWSG